MATVALVLPIVHMNGTSKEELIAQRCELSQALSDAITALASAAPNGRDYYTVPGLLQKATEQHRNRLSILTAMLGEIQEEAILIDES